MNDVFARDSRSNLFRIPACVMTGYFMPHNQLANEVAMQTFARGHDLHDINALACLFRDGNEQERALVQTIFQAYKSRVILGQPTTVKKVRQEFGL